MSLTYTDASGNQWYLDSYGNLLNAIGHFSSGSTTYSQDALDGSYVSLYVGGSAYGTSLNWGSSVASGNTQTVTGANTTAGISLTRKAYIDTGYVRILEIVTNTASAATSVRLDLTDDIYYDNNTKTVTTSSGDTTRTTADDWASYGSAYNPNYPILTHVISGGSKSPNAVSGTYADQPVTTFNLNLAAGETQVIMHFYALSTDTASATAIGNALANLNSDTYLQGVTPDELNELTNFTKNITSATSATLPVYGSNLTLTGSANITGTGNSLDNVITGNSGNNALSGLAGNDTLNGGPGSDTMAGGLGDDTYYLDDAGDVVTETSNEGVDTVLSTISYTIASRPYIENITLIGSAAGVSATGNTTNNVLNGSLHTGSNTLTGGLGDDTYVVGLGDVIDENAGEGIDTVRSNVSWSLTANLENLILTGVANIDGIGNSLANRLVGNAGKNTLTGNDGNDTIDGGTGADTMTGAAGSDTYYVDNVGDVVVESDSSAATGGTDTVISKINYSLGANVENLVLQGSAYRGSGNALSNRITGNGADNFLDGRGGNDTLVGGSGNDTYVVHNGDQVIEGANGGIDTVRTDRATYTLAPNVENGLMLNGSTTLYGNELANRITGNMANNTITGGAGNDTLNGAGGNDYLSGGDGNDLLIGDSGGPATVSTSSEEVVDGSVVALTISAPEQGSGSVKITGNISGVSLGDTGVNVVYVVDHSGSMTSSFYGTTNVGDLNSDGSSNSVLDAAIASVQKLNQTIVESGLGNQATVALIQFDDTAEVLYSGSPAADNDANGRVDLYDQLLTLRSDGGTAYNAAMLATQTYLSSLGSAKNIVFFLSDGAPNDGATYISTAAQVRELGLNGTVIRAIGMGTGASEGPLDSLDDGVDNNSAIIVTNPENLDSTLLNTSVLQLAEGAWVEIYKNGTMVDLIGSDRFSITPLGLRFESSSIALSTSGDDQISATLMTISSSGALVSTSVPIHIGNFVSNDTLVGGAGNDTLDGGAGVDSMIGGLGDDTYIVNSTADKVIETSGEGVDTVRSSLASYTLGSYLENLTLIGLGQNGTGNDYANLITGNALDNTLIGNGGNDTLIGGAGNDILIGGSGYDEMTGGTGDDIYYVDSTLDSVTENPVAGTDTVVTTLSTTLGGYASGVSTSSYIFYIENLTLLPGSSTAINALGNDQANFILGNEFDNKLYGFAGNDTLDGGTGADLMDGGDGNDTYYLDNANDVIGDSSGVDTVVAYINDYTLVAGIENLTLGNSSTVLKGAGNAVGNTLIGNAYNNVLDGLAGADTMMGGAGNDTYYVDSASDRVIELSGQGTDLVYSTVSLMLSDNVENLTLTGSSSIGGAGNAGANTITGNAGANRLLGWGGNDVLNGGFGKDTLDGGEGNDTLVGGGGADSLTGGSGNDTFDFNFIWETGTSSGSWDVINDFAPGQDIIDLSGIDANSSTAATNDAFVSLTVGGAFSGIFSSPGELYFDTTNGTLYGNTDADASAEFAIQIAGISSLTTSDLAL
ncbi:MAG: VWA domain-containing protein [Rhodocyclaceae bacterium]|nr:VWA domain-containing protein [Rhodocyclaceae bacterium]